MVLKRSLNVGVVGLGPVGSGVAASIATKARSQVYLQLFSRKLSRAVELSDRLGTDGATCAMRCHGGNKAASHTSFKGDLVSSPYSSVSKWSDVLFVCPPIGSGSMEVAKNMLLNGTLSSGTQRAAGGLMSVVRPGQYVVCHGVLDPQTASECQRIAAEKGVHFFDAPFLRNEAFLNATKVKNQSTKESATSHDYASFLSGQHTLLVSGGSAKNGNQVETLSNSTLQRLQMILPWFSDQQIFFGETVGAASTAALWFDAMTAMHATVAVEGLRLWDHLQQRSGLFNGVNVDAMKNREALWTALGNSDSSSGLLQRRGRVMQHAIEDPTSELFSGSTNNQDRFFQGKSEVPSMRGLAPIPVGSLLENVETVQSLVGDENSSAVPEFPLLTWCADSLAAAARCGWADQDVAVLAQVPNEAIANVEGTEKAVEQPSKPSPTQLDSVEFY